MTKIRSILFAACLIAAAGPASAGILYTTLGPVGQFDSASGFFVDGSGYFNQVMADPFTLGTGPRWQMRCSEWETLRAATIR